MSKFFLHFPISSFSENINYVHKILFMGSCFAENIGGIMQEHKLNVKINPHGILYNPLSIAVALHRYINNSPVEEKDLFLYNERWNSREHHGRFSNTDKKACIEEINRNISSAHDFLKQSEWLFITFGSAFVYKHIQTNQLVGNCHKVPQKEFNKSLLNVQEIVEEYKSLINELVKINKNLKVVFTVSPVRYTRDGVVENNLSKARLIDSVHTIIQQTSGTFYFPAYELIMDDLRDYRFYKTDLVHPNEQAIEYVFEKWMNAVFDEESKNIFEKMKEIITAKYHRPSGSQTNAHKRFREVYMERCEQMQRQYPFLNLSEEINFFR